MSDMTTTRDGFTTIDITHRPKRLQGENIRTLSEEQPEEQMSNKIVPNVLTLERAIRYYESNSTGDMKQLYSQTAKWLRELLDRSITVKDTPNLPDGVDIDRAIDLLNKTRVEEDMNSQLESSKKKLQEIFRENPELREAFKETLEEMRKPENMKKAVNEIQEGVNIIMSLRDRRVK